MPCNQSTHPDSLIPICAQVTHCFQQTMFGVSGDKKAVDFINYSQFQEFLGRLALLAFNFREREQRPPTVTFSGDDYSEQAKHLWFGNPVQPNPDAGARPSPPGPIKLTRTASDCLMCTTPRVQISSP